MPYETENTPRTRTQSDFPSFIDKLADTIVPCLVGKLAFTPIKMGKFSH